MIISQIDAPSTTRLATRKPYNGVKFVSLTKIKQVVQEHFGKSFEDLSVRDRRVQICYIRQMTMWLLVRYTKMSVTTIGQMFGRDHTTVIGSKKAINNYIDTDENVCCEVELLKQKLYS